MIGISTATPSGSVYEAADGLLARRGHSFHWARRLLSAEHAERATRLYGFCRRIDDVADRATDPGSAQATLAVIRQALQTGECPDAETADMLQLMRTCRIEPAVPLELIRGIGSDLGEVRVCNMDELLHYCYQVAGTVGLMMTAALDVTSPEARPHAIHLGIAMQLTNICRDVREDALMGRRYLPATLVGALEPEALVDPTKSVRTTVGHALRLLLDTADRHYESGERGLHFLPASARAGVLAAARIYRGIGTVLREREFDCWSSRAKVSTASKAAITLRALAGSTDAQSSDGARVPFALTRGVLSPHGGPARTAEVGGAD